MFANMIVWGRDMSVANIAIAIVVIAAIIGLVYVALQKFGVAIPEWVKQVFWILVTAVVIIIAIRFVASL